jgi:hypothetical protein
MEVCTKGNGRTALGKATGNSGRRAGISIKDYGKTTSRMVGGLKSRLMDHRTKVIL